MSFLTVIQNKWKRSITLRLQYLSPSPMAWSQACPRQVCLGWPVLPTIHPLRRSLSSCGGCEILEGFLGLQIFTLNTQHDLKEALAPFLDPLLGLWSTKQLMWWGILLFSKSIASWGSSQNISAKILGKEFLSLIIWKFWANNLYNSRPKQTYPEGGSSARPGSR